MPKTKISEFSATPGNNTDIDGINIAEGCAPSGINDAIRELMAQLKDFQAGTAGDSFNGPVGTTTAAAGAFTTLTTSSTVTHNGGTANGVAYLNGSKVLTTGSALSFDGTNLGIGATTPLQLLHLSSASAPGMQLTYQGVGASRIGIAAGNALTFGLDTSNGATEQMRLTSTGLGIGTSSPGAKLDVQTSGSTSALFTNGTTNQWAVKIIQSGSTELQLSPAITGNSGPSIRSVTSGGAAYAPLTLDGSTITLKYGGTTGVLLDASGNLGIGTSSPSTKLQVNFSSATAYSSGATGNGLLIYNTSTTNDQYVGITFQGEPTAGNAGIATIYGTTTSSGNMDLVFSTRGSSTLAERARITSGGNLLVGTTSDFSSARVVTDGGGIGILNKGLLRSSTNGVLQVSADPNNAYGSSAITFDVDGSEFARIDSSGNLGVGTSSPAAKLHVAGNGVNIFLQNTGATNANGILRWRGSAGTDQAGIATYYNIADTGNLEFLNGSTTNMVLSSSGNLGIGTSSIGERLVVNGNASVDIYKLRSNTATPASTDSFIYRPADNTLAFGTASTERARIDSSGNLQLGATSGSGNRLNVVGTGGIRVNEDGASTKVITIRSDFAGVDPSVMVTSNHALLLGTNNTERARITSGGDFLVGTTSGAFTGKVVALQATSASNVITAWNSATTGDNSLIGFFTDGGTGRGSITYNRAGGLVAYNTTSDYRAKDIIGPTQNTGSTIDALKIYEGVMKGATQSRPMMIAHEAQAVVPFCVSGEKDEVNEDGTPKYQQMDHASLVPLLIAEIQSLRQRVAALEAK